MLTRRAALLASVFTIGLPATGHAADQVITGSRPVSSSTIASGTGPITISGTDTVTITSTGSVGGTANTTTSSNITLINLSGATTGGGVTINNSGTINNNGGGSAVGISNIAGTPSNFRLINNAGATISAVRAAVLIGSLNAGPPSPAPNPASSNVVFPPRDPGSVIVIDNAGTMSSTLAAGYDGTINTYLANANATSGPSITLFNRVGGLVQGSRDAIKAGTMTIDNAGSILAGSVTGSDAIDFRGNDATGTVINRANGLIVGERGIIGGGGGSIGTGATTYEANGNSTNTAYQSSVRQLVITNEAGGTIRGTTNYAIGGAMGVTIDNAGVIESLGAAGINISGTASVNAITQSIITIRSNGRIAGVVPASDPTAPASAINLNSAVNPNDIVTLEAGAIVEGRINMGGGSNDILNLTTAAGGPTSATLGSALVGIEAINIAGGDWTLTAESTSSPATTIAAGAALRLGAGGTTGSLAGGNILNNGLLAFNRTGTLTQASGDAITGSGAVTVSSGTLVLNGANGYAGGTSLTPGATLRAGAVNTFSAASSVALLAGSTLDLDGFDQSVGGLAGAGAVSLGSATLTVVSAQDTTFSGTTSGTGGLVKAGAGTLTLAGTNTFSGPTAISGGTLSVTGSVAGDATVASGATLAGTGTVAGAVTVADNARLSPGTTGIGTLSVGSLSLASNAQLDFGFGRPNRAAGDGTDFISVNGALTLDGVLNIANAGGLAQGVYRIIGYGGALTDNGLTVGTVPSGINAADFMVQTAEAGYINIISNASGGAGPPPAMQFWDGSNPAGFNNDQVNGGTGTWQVGGAPSWTIADGSLNNDWGGGTAVFQATGGTVTVAGAVETAGMQFLSNGYVIAGQSGAQLSLAATATNVRVDSGISTTISAVLGGAGTLVKQGGGTLVLSGLNSFSGGTQIAGGTLRVEGGQALTDSGTVTIDAGGTLSLGSGETIGGLAGTGTVALGSNTLTVAAGSNQSFGGVIGGTGGLVKSGTGTLTLAATNTFTGGTTVSAGTLAAGANDAFGGGALTISGGATANLAGNNASFASLSGAGALVLEAGTATIGGNNASTSFTGTISGAGGSLVKVASGTLLLSGTNSYSGTTTVNGGTLAIGAAGALGAGPLAIGANGRVDLGGVTATVSALSGSGGLALGTGGLVTGGGNTATTFSGVISGAGGLTKVGTGTFTLNGANTFTGPTTVNGGTLTAGSAGALGRGLLTIGTGANVNLAGFATSVGGLTGGGGLALGSAALTVALDNATSYSGAISGTGSVTKSGSGTLTLTGTSTYTGATTVLAGTLVNNGRLASAITITNGARYGGTGTTGGLIVSGTLAPGNSIGTTNVTGAVTFQAGSVYEVEVDTTGAGDRVAATGTVTIQGGSIRVLAAAESGSLRYANTGDYTIVTGSSVSGTFNSVSSNLAFLSPTLLYGSSSVVLRLSRNDVAFAQVATTPNQRAVAGSIDATRGASPLYASLLPLSAAQAGQAFDLLSGEFYATAAVGLFNEAQEVRQSVIERTLLAPSQPGLGIWFNYLNTRARQGGGTANAPLRRVSDGYIGGVDYQFGGVRTGLSVAWADTRLQSDLRASRSDGDSVYVTGYAAGDWNAFTARAGISAGWHRQDSNRAVAYGGFSDALTGRVRGNTLQAFAEGAYTYQAGKLTAEPFVGIGYQRTELDKMVESGGAAALSLADQRLASPYGSFGVRGRVTFGGALHLDASVEDRFQRQRSGERVAALAGSRVFAVDGLNLRGAATLFSGGIAADVGRGVIRATYSGERGENYRSDAVRLTAAWRF